MFSLLSGEFQVRRLLLAAGLEPARCCHRGILSPLRLPIPPCQPTQLTKYVCRWMEVDSNHRSNLQQIYSLSPLATRESIQILLLNGTNRARTYDPLLVRQMLSQLS